MRPSFLFSILVIPLPVLAGLYADLKVAFGKREVEVDAAAQNVLYCKANAGLLGGGTSTTSTSTSPAQSTAVSSAISSSQSGSHTSSKLTTTTSTTSSASSTSTSAVSPWNLIDSYSGSTFFDGWTFWTAADPTSGAVDFLSESDGRNAGLVLNNADGSVTMGVETTATVASNRKSIRITTNATYNNGALVVLDATHMPTGCGTWPAFWMDGPSWPAGGEIDIVEGINDNTNNQVALHTSSGCTVSSSTSDRAMTGNILTTDCAALETDNSGCGTQDSNPQSFGAPFNANGGGVFAMMWDSDGIAVYFFERGSIPDDITAGTPLPDQWGTASERFPSTTCDAFTFFYDQVVIFDTTLCGDWAGSAWDDGCAASTGVSTCAAFVAGNGSAFAEAYWTVNYVKVFQTS